MSAYVNKYPIAHKDNGVSLFTCILLMIVYCDIVECIFHNIAPPLVQANDRETADLLIVIMYQLNPFRNNIRIKPLSFRHKNVVG